VTDQFFIRSRGRVEGPFSAEKLRELAGRGRFARHYEVSPDGKTWTPASSYPALFPVPTQRKIRTSPGFQPPIERGSTVVQNIVVPAEDAAFVPLSPTDMLASGPVDGQWYYAQNNDSRGPVPFSELERLALAGELHPEDFIWTDGMAEWSPAATAAPLLFESMSGFSGLPHGGGALKNCPAAVASLVFGLLGMNLLLFIGSIAAIICGHIALKEIERNPNQWAGRGMAVFGLVLGYVAVAAGIIAAVVVVLIKFVLHKEAAAS
jgi:uncharacterized protein DUF4190/uncharacterized protein DUF4339